jgi:NAD+ synthase
MDQIPDFLQIKDLETTVNSVTDFIKNEVFEKFQKSGAVLGLSGGIDSAVTCGLCVKSLNPEKILGLIMPERESDPQSQETAENVGKEFNIETKVVDITNILESFGVYEKKENIVKEKFPDFDSECKYRVVVPPKLESSVGIPYLEILDGKGITHQTKISSSEFLNLTAATSIKHRVRMALLYYHAEKDHLVVAGTTNKSEYMQGYFVKYGDGGSDIEPLVNLYKSQIYQLGKFLNVPNEVISKDASPDVWSYTTNDEEFFYSVPYKIVDLILYGRENNLSINEIQKHSKISIENIEKLLKFQDQKHIKSNHMREMPHGWLPDF